MFQQLVGCAMVQLKVRLALLITVVTIIYVFVNDRLQRRNGLVTVDRFRYWRWVDGMEDRNNVSANRTDESNGTEASNRTDSALLNRRDNANRTDSANSTAISNRSTGTNTANTDDFSTVLLLHVSSLGRSRACHETWFRRQASVGLLTFGDNNGGTAFWKTQAALTRALAEFPSAKYFAKFDDDTYVYVSQLLHKLRTEPMTHYAGYAMYFGSSVFASGGAGYVLSRAAAENVSRCTKYQHVAMEDVSVMHCLHPHTDVTHWLGFHPDNPDTMRRFDRQGHPSDRVNVPTPAESYANPVSFHYVNEDLMSRLHQKAI